MKTFKLYKVDGVTLLYQRIRVNKGVKFEIDILSGSGDEKIAGISHLMEHMFFNGTKKHTSEELGKLMRSQNTRINASTGNATVRIHTTNSVRNFEKDFALCCEMLFDSTYSQKMIDKERGVVEQEINRFLDDNERYCAWQIFQKIYNHPCYKQHTLGTPDSIKKIKEKHLHEILRDKFVQENIVVSVSGNVSARKCKKLIKQYITSRVERGKRQFVDYHKLPINGTPCMVVKQKPTNKTCLYICIKTKGMRDIKDNYYYGVYRQVLTKIKGRLWNVLRENNSLVYSYGVSRTCTLDDGYISYQMFTSEDKVNACVDALAGMLNEIRENGITVEEWENIKNEEKIGKDLEIKGFERQANENFWRYLYWGKSRDKEYEKFRKKATYEEANEYIKNMVVNEQVWVSIVGDVDKKKIYSHKKIVEILNGQE